MSKEEIIAEAKLRYPTGTTCYNLGNSLVDPHSKEHSGTVDWEKMPNYVHDSPYYSSTGLHLGLETNLEGLNCKGDLRCYVYNAEKNIWADCNNIEAEKELIKIREWLYE